MASEARVLNALPYLHWDDMRVSCPACAAPRGTGCFVVLLGGHQTTRVHPERRERAVATAALLADAREAGLDDHENANDGCPVDGCVLDGPLPHNHDWTASPEAQAADYLR